MDQSTITTLTRRGIRELSPVFYSDSDIETMTLQGVLVIGMKIKENDPSHYNTRTSLSSDTHIFSKPSDCLEILRIWDLRGTAIAVTAASNASPIVITTSTEYTISGATNASPIVITTSAAHGYETGDSIFQGGVVGNTEANGTFTITKLSTTTYSLDDTTGNAAYVSGGIAIKASLAHGMSDNAIAVVHDAAGNTAANGTFKITKSSLVNGTDDNTYRCIAAHTAAAANKPITGADYEIYWEQETTGVHGKAWISGTSYVLSNFNFSLDGSTGNAAYTSGGYVYEDVEYPYRIEKKNLRSATLNDDSGWYPRGSNIVVDDKDFTNDIILDYIASPSAITDIPAEYHMGLVAFNVTTLLRVPMQDDPSYADLSKSYAFHKDIFKLIMDQIDQYFRESSEPESIAEGIDFEDYL